MTAKILVGISFLFFHKSTVLLAETNPQFRVVFAQDGKTIYSPARGGKKTSLVLENQTLSSLLLRIGNEKEVLAPVTLRPGKQSVVEILSRDFESFSLIPLSPPSRAIPLKYGQGTVELDEQ